MFDPDHDIAAIRPKRPRGPDAAWRGERCKLVLDALREAAGPTPAAEVVRRMVAKQGEDADDVRLVRATTKRVEAALARQEKRGIVRAVREAATNAACASSSDMRKMALRLSVRAVAESRKCWATPEHLSDFR